MGAKVPMLLEVVGSEFESTGEPKKKHRMPKESVSGVELKVRIPKELMTRINTYRHQKEFDSRKDAVVALLLHALDNPPPGSRS